MPDRGTYTGRAQASIASRAFAALADSVRDYAIFLMNRHGVITFWGESARLTKWWTRDEAEGAHLRMLYPDGGGEDGTAEQHLRMAADTGEYTGEGHRMRSDGSTFWAGVTLTALRDQSGHLLGFAKVTRDLTAQRAADALLRSAAEAAESARIAAESSNAVKSGFLATISHEIRTPVNAILGYHQLLELELDGPLQERQHEYLRRASASGRHLLTLITDVLDFARLDSGKAGVETRAFRIGDVVRSALALVSPQAAERDVELVDSVSGFARELAAWGDDTSTRQILANLLSNAVKFTPSEGGSPGRVVVSAGTADTPSPDARLSGPGPWVYLRVEDNGVGIPAERLDAMFDPFIQGDMTLTRQFGGTGLGLAISRRLARLMNGEVSAHSREGEGSAFFLWLPAAPVQMADTAAAGAGGASESGVEATRHPAPATLSAGTGSLREIGQAVLADLDRVLHAYVARVRSDPAIPGARALDEPLLQDHLATFLADLASTLTTLDVSAGEFSHALRDGTAIQRLVASRHGEQRARLGWKTEEVRREFVILREELLASVSRRAPPLLTGPPEARRLLVARTAELLGHFVGISERISVASHAQLSLQADGATESSG